MIKSITITEMFEQGYHPWKGGISKLATVYASYPIPSLPIGYRLKTDSPLIVLIGDMGSGKTTLLEKLCHQIFSENLRSRLGDRQYKIKSPKYFEIEYSERGSIFDIGDEKEREYTGSYFYGIISENELQRLNKLRVLSQGQYRLHQIQNLLKNAESNENPLVFIDQPEDGVALKRRKMLVDTISQWAFEDKRQVFIATHEPLFTKVEGALIINMDDNPASITRSENFNLEDYLSA
ncbi:hypothetical protein HYT57_01760 [Candidatus Woesearchaeota archaeon]|nr:hypothetical protein [Candidatus Woesearchaeota archaeon]